MTITYLFLPISMYLSKKPFKVVMDTILSAFFLLFTTMAMSNYSEEYDKELELLTTKNPQLAINSIQEQLKSTKVEVDIERHLVLLYYLAGSLNILEQSSELDKVIAKGMKLAKDNKNIRFIIEFLEFEIYQHIYKAQHEPLRKKIDLALKLNDEIGDQKIYASLIRAKGQMYLLTGNHNLALHDIQTAIQIYKTHNDREELRISYNLLAIIYDSMEDYDSAIKYFNESLSYDDIGSDFVKSTMFYNIGMTYSYMDKPNESINYYNKALAISQKSRDAASLAYINYGLSEIYLIQENFVKSAKSAHSAKAWFELNQDLLMHFNCNLVLAEVYLKTLDYKNTELFLDLAEKQLEDLNTSRTKLSFNKLKIELYSSQNLWENAFHLIKKDKMIRESIYEKEKEDSNDEIKIKYNSQFDQEKLIYLKKQNELHQSVIQHEKLKHQYLMGLIVLVILIMIIIILLYIKQKKIKTEFYEMTITDDLTQVPNRRYILELLNKLHKNSQLTDDCFSIVMVDLDYFKNINDKFGHSVGNDVLMHFASVCNQVIPQGCYVGRLGGEEWLILLPQFDKNKTEKLLKLIRQGYNNPLSLGLHSDYKLHFSSGVVVCSGQHNDLEVILKLSDDAMYQAKNSGRNNDVYVI